MKFDRNRLLELAGIPTDESSDVLTESSEPELDSDKVVNEGADPDTLVETKLRAAIRKEIKAILEDLRELDDNDSTWMHRSIGRPQNSSSGNVVRGFLGLGFK